MFLTENSVQILHAICRFVPCTVYAHAPLSEFEVSPVIRLLTLQV